MRKEKKKKKEKRKEKKGGVQRCLARNNQMFGLVLVISGVDCAFNISWIYYGYKRARVAAKQFLSAVHYA